MKRQFEKPEKIFLFIGSLLLAITIFMMPINRVPDEAAHARMAWGILYQNNDNSFKWQQSVDTSVEVDRQEYNELFTNKVDFSDETFEFSLPLKRLMHLPQLFGMMLGKLIYPSVGVIFTLGRICNALFYLVMMFFIIKYLRYGKLALMFISLLPIMIQQAASLSYDVMNFIVISAFFAIVSNLSIDKIVTKKYLVELVLITFALYITKMNNLLLLVLLLPLNLRFTAKFGKLNEFIEKIEYYVKKYKYLVAGVAFVIVMLFSVFYLRNKGGITNFTQVMLNTLLDNKLNGYLNGVLSVGMFGFLGNFHFQLPMWLIMIDIAVLTILLMQKTEDDLNKTFGLVSGSMLPLQSAIIIGGMYFAWTPTVLGENAIISVGAQGRYFTPFIIYLVPFFISLKDKVTIVAKKNTLLKIASVTILFNFAIMVYLLLLIYWYPLRESDWLVNFRQLIGR